MKLKIEKKKLVHYFLIYISILLCKTNLYSYFLGNINFLLILGFVLLDFFVIKSKNHYALSLVIFLLIATLFVRFSVGGIGIDAWASWSVCILSISIAIKYDSRNILRRFVDIVCLFAFASLLGYLIGLLYPSFFLNESMFLKYNSGFYIKDWSSVFGPEYHYFRLHGIFLYTFSEYEPTRNIGIFTEPGAYQMVLNAALVILVFFRDRTRFSPRSIAAKTILIILTIVTCRSTTGFIGTIIIGILALINGVSGKKRSRNNIVLTISSMFLVLLAIDFAIRGSESMISEVVLGKVLNNGTIDLSIGTGIYRFGTIVNSFTSMYNHPFGIGVDRFYLLNSHETTGFVAAAIVQIGAILGVIPWFLILLWILAPIFGSKESIATKVVIIFLYFNSALMQSNAFYPALLLFTIFLQEMSFQDKKSKDLEINRNQYLGLN